MRLSRIVNFTAILDSMGYAVNLARKVVDDAFYKRHDTFRIKQVNS